MMWVKTQALKSHPAISSNTNRWSLHRFQWPINDPKKEKKCRYLEQELNKSEGEKVIDIPQYQMLE